MTTPELWLVRHGETEWSASGRHTGRTDVPLTEAGRAAARQLGETLVGEQFDLVLTSPLARAAETCRLAGFGGGALVSDELKEWDYGDYEGRRTADIRRARPGWNVFVDGCPSGESPGGVSARVDHVISRVRATDGRAIAFSHGHLLRSLAARWLGEPVSHGRHLALDTASVSILGWERESPVIRLWNRP